MSERIPTVLEVHYLLSLSHGISPASYFSGSILRSLIIAGWIYVAHHKYGEAWMAMNDAGAAALKRYEESNPDV